MKKDIWDASFEIALDCADHFKRVGDSREALEVLMTCWPQPAGRHFKIAKKACLGALDGRVSSMVAAQAFQKAAEEAGLLRPQVRIR